MLNVLNQKAYVLIHNNNSGIDSVELGASTSEKIGDFIKAQAGADIVFNYTDGALSASIQLKSGASVDITSQISGSLKDQISYNFDASGIKSISTTLDANLNVAGVSLYKFSDGTTIDRSDPFFFTLLGEQAGIYIPPAISNEQLLNFYEINPNETNISGLIPSHCFAPGTPISTPYGTLPIENIGEGMIVRAYYHGDKWRDHELINKNVVRCFIGLTTSWMILSISGSELNEIKLVVTPGHYFLCADGSFRRIDEIISTSHNVVLADGSVAAVAAERIVYSEETAHLYEQAERIVYASEGGLALAPRIERGWKTYNFEVEDLHTYIAGGVRVHNDSLGDLVDLEGDFYNKYGYAFDGNQASSRALLEQDIASKAINGRSFSPSDDARIQSDYQQLIQSGDNGRANSSATGADGVLRSYNASGRVATEKSTGSDGSSLTTGYDYSTGHQEISSETSKNAAGQIVGTDAYKYDGNGNLVADNATDANGNTITSGQYRYDANNNLIEAKNIDATGTITDAAYSNGQVTYVSKATGSGQLLSSDDYNADGSHEFLSYDAARRVTSQVDTDADGNSATTNFTYNADGTTTAQHLDSSGQVRFTEKIDANGNTISASGTTADGQAFSETVSNGQVSASFGTQLVANVVSSLGSTLGNILGGNSVMGRLVGSTIGGTLSADLGAILTASNGFTQSIVAIGADGSTILNQGLGAALGFGSDSNFDGQAESGVASLLMGEAAQALGLKGIAGGLFSTVGTSITNQLLSNAVAGKDLISGFGSQNFNISVENAIGGYLGSYLGSLVVPATSKTGAIGGQIGSTLGTTVVIASQGAGATAATAGASIGSVVPIIGTAIGAFIGEIAGTLIGNAVSTDPQAGGAVAVANGKAAIAYLNANAGGSSTYFAQIAQSEVNTINSFVGATGASITGGVATAYSYLNSKANAQQVFVGGDGVIANGVENALQPQIVFSATNNQAWQNVLEDTSLNALSSAQLSGGDAIMVAAFKSALVNDILNATPLKAVGGVDAVTADYTGLEASNSQQVLTAVAGDLTVAKDYETYLANTAAINELMAANPDSAFSIGWAATLQRAQELGLNQVASQSGWQASLNGNVETVYDKSGAVAQTVTFNADGSLTTYNYYLHNTITANNSVIYLQNGATTTI